LSQVTDTEFDTIRVNSGFGEEQAPALRALVDGFTQASEAGDPVGATKQAYAAWSSQYGAVDATVLHNVANALDAAGKSDVANNVRAAMVS